MTRKPIPSTLLDLIKTADLSWHAPLQAGLQAIATADPDYLLHLAQDHYLPTKGRLFAAFKQPLAAVRYVLVGEGPYPRATSAIGVCFMDGAVDALWSATGLSKQVNRATSLRNFMKMLLVADGRLNAIQTSGAALAQVAAQADRLHTIQTLDDLHHNLNRQGFLLLNATLVFRPDIPPAKEAKAWQPFFETILNALAEYAQKNHTALPTLVLWGKFARQLASLSLTAAFPQAVADHPYNISFIANSDMHALFKPLHLLQKSC